MQAGVFRGADIRGKRSSGNIYFIVSLILHLLVVIGFGLSGLRFRKPVAEDRVPRPEDRQAFLVVEIPDQVPDERPIQHTDLVSDRAARAADLSPENLEDLTDPYAEGDTEIREFDEAGVEVALAREEREDTRADRPEVIGDRPDGDTAGETTPQVHAVHLPVEGDAKRSAGSGETLGFRNLLSSVGRKGGLSFNTYDWDFAPYMVAMKRAIENHLFPPYAFTHMGLISGTNTVRFTVMSDGHIGGLEILGSDAHFSLDRTSVRAIESSVPFLPLPRDFPEEHLEVTAHFSYVIHGMD